MTNKIEVKGLTIRRNGKDMEFSMDEARDLYRELHRLFGDHFTIFDRGPVYVERWPSWNGTGCFGLTNNTTSGLNMSLSCQETN